MTKEDGPNLADAKARLEKMALDMEMKRAKEKEGER